MCGETDRAQTARDNFRLHDSFVPNHKIIGINSNRELGSRDCRHDISVVSLLLLLLLFLGCLLRPLFDPLLLFLLRTCELRVITVWPNENKTRVDNAEN